MPTNQTPMDALLKISAGITQLTIARSMLANLGRERTEDEDAVYRLLKIELGELFDIEIMANNMAALNDPQLQRFRAAFRKNGSN